MQEAYLHYLWRFRQFDARELRSTAGEPIHISHPGTHNRDAGPDFLDARLRIGDTDWAGHVEIHLRSSDWARHGHQDDPAYGAVILHVVFEDDGPIARPDGSPLPCLSLSGRIAEGQYARYKLWMATSAAIPCAAHYAAVPELVRHQWQERLLVGRLERKMADMAVLWENLGQDWEEAFYAAIARGLGMKINAEPMERLARSAPLKLLRKYAGQPLSIEAALLGQAGFLEAAPQDAHTAALAAEYRFLQKKHQWQPLPLALWKFLRLRPANFPPLRIAQLAALAEQKGHLFSAMLEEAEAGALKNLFRAAPHDYWARHYQLGKPSPEHAPQLGEQALQHLLINTVAPFLFLYGERRGSPAHKERAVALLQGLSAEQNRIVRAWQGLGEKAADAARTQALIELHNSYCAAKRCLDCAVGHRILREAN